MPTGTNAGWKTGWDELRGRAYGLSATLAEVAQMQARQD
ncbi:hypothetical protein ACS15_0911 [Ralstonia insidiosa]|uniref:Uncharacterized protein n=1 Tax=Ralstonia insidiosa TaxID=190721 RepID=A0AAC9FPH7_9RALS|nr:hypothetical protein ACS15_0911 [Ralstonia insidiosa]